MKALAVFVLAFACVARAGSNSTTQPVSESALPPDLFHLSLQPTPAPLLPEAQVVAQDSGQSQRLVQARQARLNSLRLFVKTPQAMVEAEPLIEMAPLWPSTAPPIGDLVDDRR